LDAQESSVPSKQTHPGESVGVAALPSGAAKKIALGTLLLGAGLLWPVPLVGVLFLVAGGFGLAIASEAELTPASSPAVVAEADVGTPFDLQPEGSSS
jgi:hypothetical protein